MNCMEDCARQGYTNDNGQYVCPLELNFNFKKCAYEPGAADRCRERIKTEEKKS